jgi:hypothetical protein
MAQPPSEHDEQFGSVNDFAPERPPVRPRRVDLESLVLWLVDTLRESTRARSWARGALALFVVGALGLVWWAIAPVAPGEALLEPIASSRVAEQPIDPPLISPGLPSLSQSDQAVSVERAAISVEKPQSAPAPSSTSNVAERKSPVASWPDEPAQVSPPLPRPATPAISIPSLPLPDDPVPVRAEVAEAVPEPPPAATVTKSASGVTTWGVSRSGGDDTSAAIQDVLGRYRTAYAALDVAGVHQVWPAVNRRSLERAFKQVEGQDVSFFSCTIDVEGAGAAAACVGTTNFIPKIGNRSPQSGPSQWNFKLSRRSAGVWLIDDVQAR